MGRWLDGGKGKEDNDTQARQVSAEILEDHPSGRASVHPKFSQVPPDAHTITT